MHDGALWLEATSNRCCRKTADRARQHLISAREQDLAHQRSLENELHALELKNAELRNKVKDRDAIHASIEGMKREVISHQQRSKVCLSGLYTRSRYLLFT